MHDMSCYGLEGLHLAEFWNGVWCIYSLYFHLLFVDKLFFFSVFDCFVGGDRVWFEISGVQGTYITIDSIFEILHTIRNTIAQASRTSREVSQSI
jgi:hypothetical protein